MKNGFGNVSGNTGPGGIRVHHPFVSSDWFISEQNSIVIPDLSWNHEGKPPTAGLLSMGPMRSRAACAMNGLRAAAAISAATPLLRLGVFIVLKLSMSFVGENTRAVPSITGTPTTTSKGTGLRLVGPCADRAASLLYVRAVVELSLRRQH